MNPNNPEKKPDSPWGCLIIVAIILWVFVSCYNQSQRKRQAEIDAQTYEKAGRFIGGALRGYNDP